MICIIMEKLVFSSPFINHIALLLILQYVSLLFDNFCLVHLFFLTIFALFLPVSTSKCLKHFGRCILKVGGLQSFDKG